MYNIGYIESVHNLYQLLQLKHPNMSMQSFNISKVNIDFINTSNIAIYMYDLLVSFTHLNFISTLYSAEKLFIIMLAYSDANSLKCFQMQLKQLNEINIVVIGYTSI